MSVCCAATAAHRRLPTHRHSQATRTPTEAPSARWRDLSAASAYMPRHDDCEQRCVFLASGGGCVTCRRRPTSMRKVCRNCKEDAEKEEKGFDTAYWSASATNDNCCIDTHSKLPTTTLSSAQKRVVVPPTPTAPMLSQAYTLTLPPSRLLPVPSSNNSTHHGLHHSAERSPSYELSSN